jgi:hypothetical protein
MTIKSATYQITVVGSQPVIERALEFDNGDTISFKVALPIESKNSSIIELHRESAKKVIETLQAWITPQ